MSWSSDGHVIFNRWSPGAKEGKLLFLALSEGGEPTPLLSSDAQERSAQFSPDGKWVAYVTNKADRDEVFLAPFPPTGEVIQTSTQGGSDPRWRGDGRELFYLDPERKLVAVEISSTETGLELSEAQVLFQTSAGGTGGVGERWYDVSADGERFLVNTVITDAVPSPMVVVTDWTDRLE